MSGVTSSSCVLDRRLATSRTGQYIIYTPTTQHKNTALFVKIQHPLTKSDSNAFNDQLSKQANPLPFLRDLHKLQLTLIELARNIVPTRSICYSRFISNQFSCFVRVSHEQWMKYCATNHLKMVISKIFGVKSIEERYETKVFYIYLAKLLARNVLSLGLSLYKTC